MTKKSLSNSSKSIVSSVAPTFHAELYGKGKSISLMLSGIRGINSFSDIEILLSTRREIISIAGTQLEITVLESRNIRVEGKIESLSFRDKKGGKK